MKNHKPPQSEGSESVELDALFRRQSKARIVAERLLTGRPQSRAELVDGLDLSLTTVPRVVEVLESAGVTVERTTDRSRQAVYKVVGMASEIVADPEHGQVIARFAHTGPAAPLTCQIVKVEVIDSAVWVDCIKLRTGQKMRGRLSAAGSGNALSLPAALLSGEAQLMGVCVYEDGQFGYLIGDDRHAVSLVSMTNV